MPHIKLSTLNQNLNLYYEVHGTGEIKILFIMGLLTDGAAWYRQTQFFLKHPDYQSVSYDNRGYGRSSSPLTLHYSTNQMAKDAHALINHLQWKQCHVVGISMGGMTALELALLAPEKILSLTLIATHAGGLSGRAPFAGVRHITRALFIRDANSLIENALTMLYSAKSLADSNKRKSLYDYHLEKFRKRLPPSIIGVIGQLTAVSRHYISYAELLKIRYSPFECLIIVGTEDRLVRESNSYMLRQVLGCRLIKLDNAGHGLQSECADEINEALLNLFETTRKKGPSDKSKQEIPIEYVTEIKALEHCCHHRTHCFIHDLIGFIQGLFVGAILYKGLSIIGLTKTQLSGIHLTFESVILLACLNGLRRSVKCVLNAFRARRFVEKHHLQLDRAARHGGIGVALPDEPKNGIPRGCGFEFPILSLIFIANMISLIYWTRLYE